MSLSRPFKEDRAVFPRYGVLGLVLAGVVSQVPQHFRSSETQATSDGCFAHQYIYTHIICSVISLHPACLGVFELEVDVAGILTLMRVWEAQSICEDVGICVLTVTS